MTPLLTLSVDGTLGASIVDHLDQMRLLLQTLNLRRIDIKANGRSYYLYPDGLVFHIETGASGAPTRTTIEEMRRALA